MRILQRRAVNPDFDSSDAVAIAILDVSWELSGDEPLLDLCEDCLQTVAGLSILRALSLFGLKMTP